MFDTLFNPKKTRLKEGRWKEFNKHAELISVGYYVQGNKHGHWMEYYDTGELLLEEIYELGILHGRFVTYHRNGSLMSEGVYVQGNREGWFNIYNDEGRHIKSLLFSANNLMEELNAPSTVNETSERT